MAKRRLKIAQIAPIAERVPPKKYGGTERVVYALTEGLVARGHDVTLFATGDSITSAKLTSVFPIALREAGLKDPYGTNELTMLNIGKAYSLAQEFDIIHDHLGIFSLPAANLSPKPVVMTFHGPIKKAWRGLFETMPNPYFVAISYAQGATFPLLNKVHVVHHGLNLNSHPFSEKPKGYLLFVGRISMEKGVHFAIEAAQTLKIPLVIAAKLDEVEKPYFEKYVKPRLRHGYVNWIGEVDEKKRNTLMANAICLLHPVTWKEPFGLVMIEAMACGCPVIAFSRGSTAEVVKDGKTGFVVSNFHQMIEKIQKISQVDRRYCREYATGNFCQTKMVDAYEEIYYKLTEKAAIMEEEIPSFFIRSPGQQEFRLN